MLQFIPKLGLMISQVFLVLQNSWYVGDTKGFRAENKAGILTDVEVKKIVDWFKKTEPTWDSDDSKGFAKTFKINGIKYNLMTDSCRGYRDLNLHIPMQV